MRPASLAGRIAKLGQMVGAPGGVLCPYLATRPAVGEHVICITVKPRMLKIVAIKAPLTCSTSKRGLHSSWLVRTHFLTNKLNYSHFLVDRLSAPPV